MSLLFAVTLFLSALLLFWVQPLAGKAVLPVLGGTPAVWNTCMLFFQGVLLAGYAYVLALTRWLSQRAQVLVHAASNAGSLLALLGFPLLLEPNLALGPQGRAWALAYFALVALVIACAALAWRARDDAARDDAQDSDETVGAGAVPARRENDELGTLNDELNT